MVDGILRQYGTVMTLQRSGETVELWGFFQPERSKSLQSMVNTASPLGEFPRGQYVYIGPADTAPAEGDTLVLGEKAYVFRRVEPYYYENEPVYIWGLCVEKGVNDTWGARS